MKKINVIRCLTKSTFAFQNFNEWKRYFNKRHELRHSKLKFKNRHNSANKVRKRARSLDVFLPDHINSYDYLMNVYGNQSFFSCLYSVLT